MASIMRKTVDSLEWLMYFEEATRAKREHVLYLEDDDVPEQYGGTATDQALRLLIVQVIADAVQGHILVRFAPSFQAMCPNHANRMWVQAHVSGLVKQRTKKVITPAKPSITRRTASEAEQALFDIVSTL